MRQPPPKDLLPQPRRRLKSAGRRVWAGFVNNRTQKTAVNPLTRLASRSVMRSRAVFFARKREKTIKTGYFLNLAKRTNWDPEAFKP
jgi:hypothetical protein